jgi:hypothetical protein
MTHTGELILRTLVFQFDGRVVEIVGGPNNDVIRYHVALLTEPQIGEPNRKGRCLVTIGSSSFSIDADEMRQLRPFLEKISQAARAARPQPRD